MGREKKSAGGEGVGGKIVILSTSTSTQIPSHKRSKQKKNDISKQHSKHMSSYKTGEVAKNYKMFANPVFITPGRNRIGIYFFTFKFNLVYIQFLLRTYIFVTSLL